MSINKSKRYKKLLETLQEKKFHVIDDVIKKVKENCLNMLSAEIFSPQNFANYFKPCQTRQCA